MSQQSEGMQQGAPIVIAGGGIGGLACALALAEGGAAVALMARSQEKLAAVAREIEAKGGQAAPFRADVSNEDEVKAAVKGALERFAKIDILVNNAGVTKDTLLLRMKRSDWDSVIQTNLSGAFFCTQAALGAMLKQRWGRIINISSVFGQTGQAGQANYSASKAGLINLTQSVAAEVKEHGIDVTCICPGGTDTEGLWESLGPTIKGGKESLIKPDEIAALALFLASGAGSAITGTAIDAFGLSNPIFRSLP